jgi:hypothetical protein
VGIGLRSGKQQIRAAERVLVKARNRRPYVYELNFVCTVPMTRGPRKPPRFPIELIIPTLPAAAVEVRKKLGKAQKAGI